MTGLPGHRIRCASASKSQRETVRELKNQGYNGVYLSTLGWEHKLPEIIEGINTKIGSRIKNSRSQVVKTTAFLEPLPLGWKSYFHDSWCHATKSVA